MNICIFGDSITWGANDFERGGWAERLKVYCMQSMPDVDVYNLGISGDNTNELLLRVEMEARAREADVIIFAIGVNDSYFIRSKNSHNVDLEKFNHNISELVRIGKSVANRIVFIGLTRVDESKTMPIPWSPDKYYSNESIEEYDEVIRNFCQKNAIDYIGMSQVVLLEDLDDGLHPNAIGHVKIFEKILKSVKYGIN